MILDGRKLAEEIKKGLREEVRKLTCQGVVPGLAVVLVGENPASRVYVRAKEKGCTEVGISSFEHKLSEETTEKTLLNLLSDLNDDSRVHGILVQLPLPQHFNENNIIEAINPKKDVDGFHPYNVGKLMTGDPLFQPCTPLGIVKMIESTGIDISGKNALVVGRSNIVGKPVALMLLQKNATVTICHSRTTYLSDKVRASDIVVAAVGKPATLRGEWIKKGSIVIDVGINRAKDGRLEGDVEFQPAYERAEYITPVPGGVGPMTIAMLLHNTVEAAKGI